MSDSPLDLMMPGGLERLERQRTTMVSHLTKSVGGLACPPDMVLHVRKVLDGEYDIPGIRLTGAPVVLDIGANVGAFAAWARSRWRGCELHCYEPNPAAFAYLEQNVPNATLYRVAVTPFRGRKLRLGLRNLGQASLYDLGEQSEEAIEVETLHPSELPRADVIKLDTEGSELDIIDTYVHKQPLIVLLEFHRERDRIRLDQLLVSRGYSLVKAQIDRRDRGVLGYLRLGGLTNS